MAIGNLAPGSNPQLAIAHMRQAIMLANQGRLDDAIHAFRQAALASPENAQPHFGLGNCYVALGRTEDAIAAFRHAVERKPDLDEAHFRLGSLLSETGRISEGFAHYMRRAALVYGRPAKPLPNPEPAHKIKHDREQQDYLAARLGHTAIFHLENGERIAGPAINPEIGKKNILDAWNSAWPQAVVLDDFLTPEALDRLRLYCAGSTIWRRIYPAGYIGATPEDGFACPLMAQIAEEIRDLFPEILAAHPFRYMGAFKYDSTLSTGTNIHADNSAVNLNFYIAPDEANLDPESGGMDIWDIVAPEGEKMRVYNGDEALARQFLRESNARLTRIPHRANRAVLFKSDLFHKTSDCKFREGYLNKRINISLLFGNRGTAA